VLSSQRPARNSVDQTTALPGLWTRVTRDRDEPHGYQNIVGERWAMPVLILAVASFLLFFVIIVLLCVASTLDSRAIERERILTFWK
jgi:hypothetical protein